ncbi:hypothetical protein FY034_17235 (plasmid) [Trichlorobacter lovleyi]|uniref:hypothetical protein n=1 Tax=Trichlorobacter lovleyi TaxID=313985 RepID=UPI00223FC182|nr:hypothetical protein [Trichlorobacter lovleyi]QOX80767.1 hypothetical protein FY034_17235 [Trichlorobacter lovleyi]
MASKPLFRINGQSSLPFAVEVVINHLRMKSFKRASEVGSMMTDSCKDLAREIWEAERRMLDTHDIPICPF